MEPWFKRYTLTLVQSLISDNVELCTLYSLCSVVYKQWKCSDDTRSGSEELKMVVKKWWWLWRNDDGSEELKMVVLRFSSWLMPLSWLHTGKSGVYKLYNIFFESYSKSLKNMFVNYYKKGFYFHKNNSHRLSLTL